jgi:uncharacterized protein YigA (DUF484 family)
MSAKDKIIEDSVASLNPDDVKYWLESNTNFFEQHPELLLSLKLSHPSGRAISLLEKQLEVYRQRLDQFEARFQEVLDNARENDELFEKTRLVVLDILRCSNLVQLRLTIEDKLRFNFSADAVQLVFVSDNPQSTIFNSLPDTAVRTALGAFYEKQRTWCGSINQVQRQLLFEDSNHNLVSAAIVPLHLPEFSPLLKVNGHPLLLVGSVELSHFNSSLDTLFLDFIGEVVAAQLHNLGLHD